MDMDRINATLEELNAFGASSGRGITRLAYSDEHWNANRYFIERCRKEGMTVRIDAAGNVIARKEGAVSGLPAVACGSHLDTVHQGGKYDGAVGVAAGLEIIRGMNEQGIATRHPIEIISFACEESARFGVSTIGSKAMTGKLNKASLRALTDQEGIALPEALEAVQLDFDRIETAARQPDEMKAFFELHIEQGPILETREKQIGIVTGIAAPTRLEVSVQGRAAHSGTTPMNMRKDALVGAAQIIGGLELAALAEARFGTVATVGVCNVRPGAMNVVPDSALLKIDIRGTIKSSIQTVVDQLYAIFREVEKVRGLTVVAKTISNEEPVLLDDHMVGYLSKQCELLQLSSLKMTSGAGHDAMNMAGLCPTGLIFIPSRNGVSHHADEYTPIQQIFAGAVLLEQAVLAYAEVVRPNSASFFQIDRSLKDENVQTRSVV